MNNADKEKLEEIKSYLRSDENLRKCQPFIDECKRLSEKAKEFDANYRAIYDELSAHVRREEYGVGGETIHRGFYNPSPVTDIVLENSNRGKLLKQMNSKSKPIHKYMFDGLENLILVESFPLHLGYKEAIIRQDEIEKGISFDKSGIQALSECIYHGNQILSYVFCLFSTNESRVVDYTKEKFEYSESGLSDVSIDRFLNSQETPILRQEKYRFKHDTEGYLLQYSTVETHDGVTKKVLWNDNWIDIKIKRKV
ncbi:MAG: hypothetical protein PHV95_11000 [Eubacteriales bacterium]|nr:hypothetical protein [Eubacteriales bacterium]